MSIYLALLFNLFVNPIALAAIAWKYYIVFICVLIIATIAIYFAYPETKGFTLEEVAVVFDGHDLHLSEYPGGEEKTQGIEAMKEVYAYRETTA